MIKKFSRAAVCVVMTAGMVSASAISAEAAPPSSQTCKERGYHTIVAQKNINKGGKRFATAFVTYNSSKSDDYCLVARNYSGAKATFNLVLIGNNGGIFYRLSSSTTGATGSLTFDRAAVKEQFVATTGATAASFYY